MKLGYMNSRRPSKPNLPNEPNLVFRKGFPLKIRSGSSLHFVGIRGIYIGVRMEFEESVFQNKAGWQLGLATSLSREFKPRAN